MRPCNRKDSNIPAVTMLPPVAVPLCRNSTKCTVYQFGRRDDHFRLRIAALPTGSGGPLTGSSAGLLTAVSNAVQGKARGARPPMPYILYSQSLREVTAEDVAQLLGVLARHEPVDTTAADVQHSSGLTRRGYFNHWTLCAEGDDWPALHPIADALGTKQLRCHCCFPHFH
jgi:hypothetical protein